MREAVNLEPKYKDQAINLLVGECLGEGAYRRVFALRHDPALVLKVDGSCRHDNVREWLAWEALEHTEWSRWLAPCVSIDEFAGVMLQRRADPLTDGQWAALREYPSFLSDCGRRNWGWYDGRPVMVDYAHNHLVDRGLGRRSRMVSMDHALEGS